MKLFSSKDLTPLPRERGWGEAFQSGKSFRQFSWTIIKKIFISLMKF